VIIARPFRARRRAGAVLVVAGLLAGSLAACSSGPSGSSSRAGRQMLPSGASNPMVAAMLTASTDLGPSRARHVDVLVTLHGSHRPTALYKWTAAHQLAVTWQRGDSYAVVGGTAAAMSRGFAVSIHDYRAKSGKRFYATTRYAHVPRGLHDAVTGVGSILSYFPKTTTAIQPPGGFLADVPPGGLMPSQVLRAYDASSLAQAGYTGKNKTVVFFELDGYTQADMDKFAQASGTSRFTPVLDSTMPGKVEGETEMDLEVVHAIVPDAKLVVFNIATAWAGAGSAADYMAHIATSYKTVEQKYPGSVWSISIGSACDRYFTAADLQPLQDALQQATAQGTSVFMSSGDTGGLECKGVRPADFGAIPTQDDVGVSAINTPPAVTSVGGTALNTDKNGGWISEQAWSQFAVQQGTSGGPSLRFARPAWQTGSVMSSVPDTTHRLTPDVSADADPDTGVKVVIDGKLQQGGGTSQSAPIWAGLTVLMNQYLEANGGKALGDINPLLYKAAATTPSAFHDVTLGGNAPYLAGKGFDYLTGLGTPDVGVLVKALQSAQEGS
jgi:kumamolisin